MDVSWIDIINDDTGLDQDPDVPVLPGQIDVELPDNPNLRREISYRFDEEKPDVIIRSERTYELVNTKKKISSAAIKRKREWVKFGACSQTPKGELERGVTNQRDGHFPFLWKGKNMTKKVRAKVPKANKAVRKTLAELRVPVPDAQSTANTGPDAKYRPRQLRAGFEEEEKPEIKISNLPQWTDFMHIKQLVDAFHRNVLGATYISKYKIRMIPSNRTLEEWKKDPKMYAHRLAEYERLSIVQFDDEQSAQKAIEVLDGRQYSNHILRVEKAKPRRM